MKKYFVIIIILIFSLIIFPQFRQPSITGGDYVGLSYHTFANQITSPSWSTQVDLGWNGIPFLQYYFFSIIQYLLSFLFGGNLVFVEKVTWWGLSVFHSIYSSSKLSSLFIKEKKYQLVSSLIFLINTYSLMILSGGQIAGIGLAYSIAPLLFYAFLKLIKEKDFASSIFFSILLSTSVIFDIRITFVVCFGLVIYSLLLAFQIRNLRIIDNIKEKVIHFIIIPGVVILVTHLYWIVPLILFPDGSISQLGTEYTSGSFLKFLSFAKLENTLSLLHPNWPENLFGKTYFMKPLFILFPIIVSAGLYFQRKSKTAKNYYIFFVILLISAFLAKGVNEPFGSIYEFCFNNLPGFNLLRDPTKWFVLITITYSLLIPMSLEWLGELFDRKKTVVVAFIMFYIILLSPFVKGLNGTFITTKVPTEILSFQKELNNDPNFSRVLWFPSPHYYHFSRVNHPIIFPSSFLKSSDPSFIARYINSSSFRKDLNSYRIGYIVLFEDFEEEKFLKKQIYTNSKYNALSNLLSKKVFLKKIDGYNKISVYKTDLKNAQLSLSSGNLELVKSQPDKYYIRLKTEADSILAFSERFNPYWILTNTKTNKVIHSKNSNEINTFIVPKTADTLFKLEFYPRRSVSTLIPISVFGWIVIIFLYLSLKFKRTKTKSK